jgi:hypothetical protein
VISAVAWASIPGSDGVIHACYKNNGGQVVVIDSGASCPSGYTALNWSQPGMPGYEMVSNSVDLSPSPSGDRTDSASVNCPSGKAPTGGGATVTNASGDPGFTTSERLQVSQPRLDSNSKPVGWEAIIAYSTTFGSFTGTLTVRAICASP